METIIKRTQEQPAQNIIATTVTEEPQLSYDPLKADRIAKTISELLDPEYVLLFGKLANGTPHSDILAYDLLAITDGPTRYDWYAAKRYLKMKLPYIGHGAPYVNIYVYSRQYIDANVVPVFYWARKEGIVLHSSRRRKLSRPRNEFDFGYAATLAKRYAGIFMPPADRRSPRRKQPYIITERCSTYTTVSRRILAIRDICTTGCAHCRESCRCCSSRTIFMR